MRKTRALALATGLGLSMIGVFCNESEAHAEEPPSPAPATRHFGDRGDVVLPIFGSSVESNGYAASTSVVGFEHSSMPVGDGELTTTTFAFAPSADFFVARHFSIGGTISGVYQRFAFRSGSDQTVGPDDSGAVQVGVAPRVGFVASLGEHLAVWPRLQIGVAAADSVGDDSFIPDPFIFSAKVDVPFVYSIDRHFYASLAPFVSGLWRPKDGGPYSASDVSAGTALEIGFVL